ncbi:hypothetical protein SAMN05216559_2155 [Halomicrobium zhouii]|uniref:Uncharacterized protein n=1 Tax=Halomicrobium zhouii TaxID=767519 RepID=A0A1I6L6Q3_9EURY|nr:hypothetical protein [Halomicrobium zhouii]SFR99104.1 hypothetical protein SAMN05216559_2155 [Halomicrobium zhouii]
MASDIDDTAERTDVRRVSRYDLVLAVIPTAFLLAGIASLFVSAPTRVVLTGAAAVGLLALVDGMFVNPPRSGSGTL